MPLSRFSLFFALTLLSFIVVSLYYTGLNGAFYYDDFRPLGNLTNVTDIKSAFFYISNETSGILGRPVSMLSFLFNVNDWPSNQRGFLVINLVIHVANTLLVFTIARLLLRKLTTQNPLPFAFLAALIWALSPLSISTTLIAIQRMAGLSAFFVLLGISLYLTARLNESAAKHTWLKIAAVFLCGLLALFSKENGVLLPVFLLVLEATLLYKYKSTDSLHKYYLYFFKFTLCCVFLLLSYYFFTNLTHNYSGRVYNSLERLYTQSYVLLDYVQLFFIPKTYFFNPFHDDYPIAYGATVTNITVLLLHFGLAAFAFIKRRSFPLFAFAILWFYSAHLLESTSVGLEMYFEHRNYLAFIGVIIALVLAVTKLPSRYIKLAQFILLMWGLMLAGMTYSITAIWGNQILAAHIWHNTQPASSRAAEHYALLLLDNNKPNQAYEVIERTVNSCPRCLGSRTQLLLLQCHTKKEQQVINNLNYLQNLDPTAKLDIGNAAKIYSQLFGVINTPQSCQALTADSLIALNKALLILPNIKQRDKLATLFNLYNLERKQGNDMQAVAFLQQAWRVKQAPEIAKMLLTDYLRLNIIQQNLESVALICNNKTIEHSACHANNK